MGRARSSTRQCLRVCMFFLTVNLMFLSWNWEEVYSKMIVKSIFRCRKTINSPKNCYWEKTTLQRMISRHSPHSSRRWQQQLNNTHLFSLLSVNKFKRFLLNFLIKHMGNASSCTAELWMHSWDSGLLSSQELQELRIVYWRHPGAPNGSVPHNICSTEKILLAGNWGFGCSAGK